MALPIIDDVLAKEMDRKEFLMHVGTGLLAVIGVSGVLKSLRGDKHQATGYGASTYGGGRRDLP